MTETQTVYDPRTGRVIQRKVWRDRDHPAVVAATEELTSAKAEAALQALNHRTLAQIAAFGAADPRAADIENDPRLAYLASIAGNAPEITAHGYRGFVQIMGNLTSSSHWRRKRINCLATARRSKLKGFPNSIPMWLRKAADFRREEQFSLHLERSRAIFASIDANISRIAAE